MDGIGYGLDARAVWLPLALIELLLGNRPRLITSRRIQGSPAIETIIIVNVAMNGPASSSHSTKKRPAAQQKLATPEKRQGALEGVGELTSEMQTMIVVSDEPVARWLTQAYAI